MFMPEQAHVMRHAVARLASTWLLQLDLDEYLTADGSAPGAWRGYLTMLGARKRQPGGVRVTQLQMVGSLNETRHLVSEPSRWQEEKCIVRRAALHEHPRAFGSIHEVTLQRGEFYVPAPRHVLALLHYRYVDFQARLRELGCANPLLGRESALMCKLKRSEIHRWGEQRSRRAWARLPASRDQPHGVITLALSTIVTHQSHRFDAWLAHHLDSGVSEVFVFWLEGARGVAAGDGRVHHHDLETALAAGNHRTWWLARRSSSWCDPRFNPAVILRRRSDVSGMCQRRLYMPEQALAFRYVVAHARSAWVLAIDVDETLQGHWAAYLGGLEARTPVPGGVKLLQLQLVAGSGGGAVACLAPLRRAPANEKKVLVRRAAVHPDARAFASIHEPTLASGEFYVRAPTRTLARTHTLLQLDGQAAATATIPRSLRCATDDDDCRRAVAWWRRFRVREYARWKADLKTRDRLPVRECLPAPAR